MSVPKTTGELTLGPVLFNWAPERWRDFYFRIADEAPLDIVYLGEVVCFKRAPLFGPHAAPPNWTASTPGIRASRRVLANALARGSTSIRPLIPIGALPHGIPALRFR